jgi:hypothetical protein
VDELSARGRSVVTEVRPGSEHCCLAPLSISRRREVDLVERLCLGRASFVSLSSAVVLPDGRI